MALIPFRAVLLTAALGMSGTALAAPSADDVLNSLLGQTTPAESGTPAPAPAAPLSEGQRAKFFDVGASADDLLEALLPAPQTKDLAVIPRDQQRAAGLFVTFAHDSDRLTDEARALLVVLAAALRNPRMQPYRVRMTGHTDITGEDGYNLDLSRRRAFAVRSFLVANFGIDPSALHVDGVGERELVDPSDPYGRKNRSVMVAAIGKR